MLAPAKSARPYNQNIPHNKKLRVSPEEVKHHSRSGLVQRHKSQVGRGHPEENGQPSKKQHQFRE
jgi:hypothetical protein